MRTGGGALSTSRSTPEAFGDEFALALGHAVWAPPEY